MANGVKKIAIFAIMGAFLLISLAGCGKASAAKGSSSSSSSSKATASSTKKSSSEKSSSKSSSSTTKSSVVASSSSVAASSSSVAASTPSTASSSSASSMNIYQLARGNFSSVSGIWKDGYGDTLTISTNSVVCSNAYAGNASAKPTQITINNDYVTSSSDPTLNNVILQPNISLQGSGASVWTGPGNVTGSGGFPITIGFYPVGVVYPQMVYDGLNGYLPTQAPQEKILLSTSQGAPQVNNFFYRQ